MDKASDMGKHVTKRRGRTAAEQETTQRVAPPAAAPEAAPAAAVQPPAPAPVQATAAAEEHRLPAVSAAELYRRERARRGMDRPENDLLAEARAAYKALLEAEAASGKGGRPRSKAPGALRKEAAAAAEVADEGEIDLGATAEHEVIDVEVHDDEPAETHEEPAEVEEEHLEVAPPKRPRRTSAAPARGAASRGKAAGSRAKTPARKTKSAPPPKKRAGRSR